MKLPLSVCQLRVFLSNGSLVFPVLFCMIVDNLKLAEPDFLRKFIFAQKWAK